MSLLLGPDLLDIETHPVLDHEPELPGLPPSPVVVEDYYPELRGWFLKTWRAFLPFNYAQVTYGAPKRVQDEVGIARELGVFTQIETWGNHTDPVVVGIVDGRYFRIASWMTPPRWWVYFHGPILRVLNPASRRAVRRLH